MEDLPANPERLTSETARRYIPWGRAWIGLALALALHVLDEAAGDFLSFYNPLAESIRARWPLPFPPVFGFGTWLGGLIVGVVALLAVSTFAFQGRRWMRPVSYALGLLMIANGLTHLIGSVVTGRVIGGTYSAPLLVAAAIYLLVTARAARSRA